MEMSKEDPLMSVPASGGAAAKVAEGCALSDWSADGDKALCMVGDPPAFSVLDLRSQRRTELLKSSDSGFMQARFSPDGRWVSAIQTRGRGSDSLRLIVVPLRDGVVPEADWITAFDGATTFPCWSPDSNAIYFSANHEGFICIWAQRLVRASKRPAGPPVPVYHFHNTLGITDTADPVSRRDMTVSAARIVVSLGEITGNIWMWRQPGR
jgi:hypothetical protein